MIDRFLHASLIVNNSQTSIDFYSQCFGFHVDESRPDLGFPGAWLHCGNFELHLLEVPNPDPVNNRPLHGGRDRHLAFAVSDLDQIIDKLNARQVAFTLSKSGRRALFCRDPDGNTLEFVEIKQSFD